MKKYLSKSLRETRRIAERFASSLNGGVAVILSGDLGGGKTTFSQAVARAIGVRQRVTSPTFTMMKVYPARGQPNIRTLCHIDAYRVKTQKELLAIGAGEYLNDDSCLCLIEWGEKIEQLMPNRSKKITFAIKGKNEREIKIY